MSTDPRAETLRLLTSIDVTLKQILSAVSRAPGPVASGPRIADDRDLDSKYGDPAVKFNPKDWSGESFKGSPMSLCPPDFLDQLAESFDYFAEKNAGVLTTSGQPKAEFDRRAARRARGWARRLRTKANGGAPEPTTNSAPAWTGNDWPTGEGF